jgi:hypothetical protein
MEVVILIGWDYYLTQGTRAETIRIRRILAELPNSNKLEPSNPIGPQMILAMLPHSSYEEDSRQAGRPSGPQRLATLPTRLCLATTLRMEALQVESPKYGVCSDFHR